MRERIKDKNRLEHILDSINIIQSRTAGLTYEELTADKVFFAGIVYYTMIIGEAAYMLTREFREQHTDMPWDQIVSMRHHIVHGYYQVDESIVWDVIQEDLTPLKQQVEAILAKTDWSEWEESGDS
ncbi:MAG: DUF86 domain-containing protein [Prevotella sp.]|nr:DUF86 domain-containing protein [Prevotella sp.]MBR6495071.1 DUF86 domain-containing protein [Prevotella sp.]